MLVLTARQIGIMIPTNKEIPVWCAALNEMLPRYAINTPRRVAGFMAQCGHESRDFTVLEENLKYSAGRLLQVFPRYFGPGRRDPEDYAFQPEKLANYVYMDAYRSRSGALGNVKPGDGWRFRGKGIKQITGRWNHAAFGAVVGMTAEQAASYLLTKQGALESALWFWQSRNLNAVADAGDIASMTRIINGGAIGLADRRIRYDRAIAALTA